MDAAVAGEREQRRAAARARGLRQLFLVIVAVVLAVGAWALVSFGLTGKAPPHPWGFVGVIAAVYLVAHLVTVRFAPGADPAFLPSAAVLAGVGYAMIDRIQRGLVESGRPARLASAGDRATGRMRSGVRPRHARPAEHRRRG